MNDKLDTRAGGLIDEIGRYLAAVDAYRAAGCEPTWRPELRFEEVEPRAMVASKALPSDIRLH